MTIPVIAIDGPSGSGKGVIYTSPDLSTWTLRHTHTQSVAITALATKYPETQLASTKIDFSPSYNGARAPTQLGFTYADYISSLFSRQASAIAETDLSVQRITGDCIINLVGRQSGADSDNGSTATQADTDIFTLNEEPDSIRITTAIEVISGSTVGGGGSKDLIYNPIVDGAFFAPVINQLYGVQADARNV